MNKTEKNSTTIPDTYAYIEEAPKVVINL